MLRSLSGEYDTIMTTQKYAENLVLPGHDTLKRGYLDASLNGIVTSLSYSFITLRWAKLPKKVKK
jgi:CRISPR/Cas system endoribonuclease Cas6 (RAMP superfamily)